MNHSLHRKPTSSTRLSRRDFDALALDASAQDALTQHDALQKRRWKRALSASLCINLVAWSAFSLWKNVLQPQATSENAPLTWTIETSPLLELPMKSSTRVVALSSSRADQTINALSTVADRNREPKAIRRTRAPSIFSENEPQEPRTRPSRSVLNRSVSNRFRAITRNSARVAVSNNAAPPNDARQSQESVENRAQTSRLNQSNNSSSLSNRASESGFGAKSSVGANANGIINKNGAARNGFASGNSANNTSGNANLSASAAPNNSSETAPAETAQSRPADTSSTRSAPETPQETPRESPRNEAREPTRTEKPEVTRAEKAPEPKPAAPLSTPMSRRRVVSEAEVLHREKVRMPRRLRREKRKASVVIETEIDERGRANPRVKESSGDRELDEVVLKAARKTRFKPREEDGVATKSTKSTRYEVDIKDSDESSDEDGDDSP